MARTSGISMVSRRFEIALLICLLAGYYFFLWQFDHTVAGTFWANPLMHQKVIDGWFLGYISGIDVYNTCMVFLILVPLLSTILNLLPTHRMQWCFNSHGNLDPPKWKVIIGTLVIFLTDLYAGITLLSEEMTRFDLAKTSTLIFIHALIVAFMFLQKTEEEKKT